MTSRDRGIVLLGSGPMTSRSQIETEEPHTHTVQVAATQHRHPIIAILVILTLLIPLINTVSVPAPKKRKYSGSARSQLKSERKRLLCNQQLQSIEINSVRGFESPINLFWTQQIPHSFLSSSYRLRHLNLLVDSQAIEFWTRLLIEQINNLFCQTQ